MARDGVRLNHCTLCSICDIKPLCEILDKTTNINEVRSIDCKRMFALIDEIMAKNFSDEDCE